MAWVVYKHTNKINGKHYVGITCQIPEVRWGKNGSGYKPRYDNEPTKFWNAIVKYGWDGFTHDIIEEGIETAQEAADREKYWVKYYNSYIGGYNSDEGGKTNNFLFKPVLQIDPKTLQIINRFENISLAEISIGTTSISSACHGHCTCAGGYYWCFEADYENWIPPEDRTRVPVYQISMENLSIINKFMSYQEAARAVGNGCSSSIGETIRGLHRSAFGYYWCRVEDWSPDWRPRDRKIAMAHAVVCWDTGEIFESACKVKDKYGIPVPNIIACCTGKTITAKNLHFCYLEDYEKGWKPRQSKCVRAVICYETLEIFKSTSEADRWLEVSIGSVSKVCLNYRNATHCKGYHFCYLDEWFPEWTPEIKIDRPKTTPRAEHPLILWEETGLTFKTYAEAAEASGCGRTAISKCCHGQQKQTGGQHFSFVKE